ncbi:MAG TPA: OmpH family outer membrane protein [Blastocatellia bacterium]|nr:OmpH family outer membrane protein [Blastocatellia bacterium]
MKKILFSAALSSLLSFAMFAQTPVPQPRPAKPSAASTAPPASSEEGGTGAEGKIGYLNTAQFSQGLVELKVRLDALANELEPKKKELQSSEEDLTKLRDKIQTQGGTVSPQIRGQWVEEATQKETALKRKSEDYEVMVQKRLTEVYQPIYDKVQKFLGSYCPPRGIVIVFEGGSAYQSGVMVWNSPSIDITDDFIKEYNKVNPASPAASTGTKKD